MNRQSEHKAEVRRAKKDTDERATSEIAVEREKLPTAQDKSRPVRLTVIRAAGRDAPWNAALLTLKLFTFSGD